MRWCVVTKVLNTTTQLEFCDLSIKRFANWRIDTLGSFVQWTRSVSPPWKKKQQNNSMELEEFELIKIIKVEEEEDRTWAKRYELMFTTYNPSVFSLVEWVLLWWPCKRPWLIQNRPRNVSQLGVDHLLSVPSPFWDWDKANFDCWRSRQNRRAPAPPTVREGVNLRMTMLQYSCLVAGGSGKW